MKKKINVAIIGLGVGERHINTLVKNKYVKNIKIFDKNLKKLNFIKKKYKLQKYNSIKEVFEDSQTKLVIDASYDNFHYKHILSAIKFKKNIFVEKPAVQKEFHAKKCFDLIKSSNLFIGTNYILRSSPRFKKIKKMIDNKKFGKIYYIEGDYNYGRLEKLTKGWRGQIPFYSITLGGGIHIIDIINFFLNKKILEVKSYANKLVTDKTNFKYKDNIVSILKFQNNELAKISSNFSCVYPHFHKLNIYGSKLTFENGFDHGRVFYKRGKNDFKRIKDSYKPINKGEVLNDFIENLIYKKNRNKYINQIFDSLCVGFAIDKSLKSNKSIKIKYFK